MRNVLPAGPDVCATCHTFTGSTFDTCYPCGHQPDHIDAMVPITYSEHLGQMHTALRNYKDSPPPAQEYALPRLAAILWRFSAAHEACVAAATGVDGFDLVTAVPSSTPERDERRSNLRTMVGWCEPLKDRYRRVLRSTGDAPEGRAYDPARYEASERLDGSAVLLIDDTWVSGGHAQSAAHSLLSAGATHIGMIVIGRHFHRDWELSGGETSGERFDALPKTFDWETCAVHNHDQS